MWHLILNSPVPRHSGLGISGNPPQSGWATRSSMIGLDSYVVQRFNEPNICHRISTRLLSHIFGIKDEETL